jgi:hypothetical protein
MDMTTHSDASQVHRFAPSRAVARQETLGGALFALLATLAVLYARGERNWLVLLGFALAAGAVVWVGFAVRTRTAWVDAIELSPGGVTLFRGDKERTMAWTEVKSIRHETRGGEHWLLMPHAGRDPLLIRDDGLSRDEARALRELIPTLHAAAAQDDGAAPVDRRA